MEKLSELERRKLIIQHRRERDKRVCDRIKAVLAFKTMDIVIQKLDTYYYLTMKQFVAM